MIYFDNAATSFPKPKSVIKAVNDCISKYCGNPGRSSHRFSLLSAEKIYEAREAVAALLGWNKPENIIFTQNATYALNLSIKGIIKERCHVITSDIEHNSVLRPLYSLEKDGLVEISVFDSDLPLREAIIPLIKVNTKYIVASIASNVTGKVIDANELSNIAKEYNLITIIDATQYLGHNILDLRKNHFDVVCSAGHKSLYGIQGVGFALISENISIDTIIEGGSGIGSFSEDMPDILPERLEAGTLNTPAIVSLLYGIKFIDKFGLQNIQNKLKELDYLLYERLLDLGVNIIGCNNGICSFYSPKVSSSIIANELAKGEIAVRSGIHCAPLIAKKLHYEDGGSVRISTSIFNKKDEIDKLYYSLCDILK